LHHPSGIESLLIYLAAAVVLVPLCRAAGVSTVLGYLATGVLIGPSTLGLVTKTPEVEIASEVGVLFLLFAIGLELSTEKLRALRGDAFGLGMAQIGVTAAALAAVVFAASGSPAAAVAVGFSLALSSTAIVLQLLRESGELSRRTGRAALAVLLLQDLAVVPLLVLIPLVAGDGVGLGSALALAAVKAALAIAVIIVLGRLLLGRLYQAVTKLREAQIGLALTLLVALGTGWATAELGLSATLGAFLAGLVIAETEFRHQVEADIEPFRGLLLGVFFMSVGLSIDLAALAERAGTVALLVVLLLGIKGAILFGLARLFGLGRANAAYLSLLLAQAGEFGFIALGLAIALGLLTPTVGAELLGAVAVTMFVTPALAVLGKRLELRLQRAAEPGPDALAAQAGELEGHVVVAGCGRVGSTTLRLLAEGGISAIAIDADPLRVRQLRSLGFTAFVGDAARPLLLHAAGVERAQAAVVTLDDPPAAERVCAALRSANPAIQIVARASDFPHGERLLKAGASVTVAENLEGSLELAGRALAAYKVPLGEIERRLDELRADDYARLVAWRTHEGKD
jgi:CPA2 family monovalent cation:H+ antiporter-2